MSDLDYRDDQDYRDDGSHQKQSYGGRGRGRRGGGGRQRGYFYNRTNRRNDYAQPRQQQDYREHVQRNDYRGGRQQQHNGYREEHVEENYGYREERNPRNNRRNGYKEEKNADYFPGRGEYLTGEGQGQGQTSRPRGRGRARRGRGSRANTNSESREDSRTYVNQLDETWTKIYGEVSAVAADNVDEVYDSLYRVLYERGICLQELTSKTHTVISKYNKCLNNIQTMIQAHHYAEACNLAMALQLHTFSLEEFIIPLILQDKKQLVEKYLTCFPHLQNQLVKYLDRSCANRGVKLQQMARSQNIPHVVRSQITQSAVARYATYLTKLFNLAPEILLNVNKSQVNGAVNHMLNMFYKHHTISTEAFNEMIEDTVNDDSALQKEVVRKVAKFGKCEDALYWADQFNISSDSLPKRLKDYLDNKQGGGEDGAHSQDSTHEDDDELQAGDHTEDHTEDHGDVESSPEAVNPEQKYHQLTISPDNVHMITSEDQLHDVIDDITQNCTCIGFDSEWKPYFSYNSVTNIALIQLATKDKVYLLDMMALADVIKGPLGKEIITSIMANPNITKLGYGTLSDFSQFRETLPAFSHLADEMKNKWDLEQLSQMLLAYKPHIFPHYIPEKDEEVEYKERRGPRRRRRFGGLAYLSQLCTGAPIEKKEQFSNWERRPLRQNQVIYAALDAHVLLECWDVIQSRVKELNLDWEELITEARKLQRQRKEAAKAYRRGKRDVRQGRKGGKFSRDSGREGEVNGEAGSNHDEDEHRDGYTSGDHDADHEPQTNTNTEDDKPARVEAEEKCESKPEVKPEAPAPAVCNSSDATTPSADVTPAQQQPQPVAAE